MRLRSLYYNKAALYRHAEDLAMLCVAACCALLPEYLQLLVAYAVSRARGCMDASSQ